MLLRTQNLQGQELLAQIFFHILFGNHMLDNDNLY